MTENPLLKQDRLILGDIYTSAEVMDNLAVLCDEFGSRFGGTAGERKAAEFIKSKLEAYGLQNVRLEPFEYVGWTRGEVSLRLVHPIQKEIPCITLPHSPAANLTGKIVDVGDGGPEEFEKWNDKIPGNIVMVNSKTRPRGTHRWVHRNEKYGRALMAGAAGFIFVNHYPGYGPATGGVGDNAEALIPAISLSYENGAYVQRLLKRGGEVTIELRSSDNCQTMTSWNIVGELPGRLEGAEIVMLGCHVDGHDISQGAQDPASGAVAVIEAARVLAKYAGDLPHSIHFALWGVEEIGLIGSREFVRAHSSEMGDFRFYFNMDGAGAAKSKDMVLNEWPALESLIEQWRKEMALDFEIAQSVHAHSDHFPFLMAGVPTAGMSSAVEDLSGRGYGHTAYDTLDKVQLNGLREAAALGARIALRAAAVEKWPAAHRKQEEIAALFDEPHYREEREIMARIADFKAEMRAKR